MFCYHQFPFSFVTIVTILPNTIWLHPHVSIPTPNQLPRKHYVSDRSCVKLKSVDIAPVKMLWLFPNTNMKEKKNNKHKKRPAYLYS